VKAAVVGMGCICALGKNLRETVDNLLGGVVRSTAPSRIPSDLNTRYPVFEVGPHPRLTEHEDETTLRTSQLLAIAVDEAMEGSGALLQKVNPTRIGIVFGTTVGCAMNNEDFYRQYLEGSAPDMGPITRYLCNNPALFIRERCGFQGIAQTVNNACASGTDAIGQALSWIEAGLCDVVIAGGTDELCRVVYNGFVSLQVYSESAPKPFSANRTGLNLGEGAAVMILARPDLAPDPQGYVLSYGTASDAYHPTAPHPEGEGLVDAIRQAMSRSETTVDQLAFINAHGTSTYDNDKVEGGVFNRVLKGVPFFSPKSQTGHTLGAAGAIEAVITLDLLNRKAMPASAGFEEQDREIPCRPNTEPTTITRNRAISTSLAFGGTNSAILLEGKA
jgi:3-oxoacyl-(acyl-carrier-protein) synthase